MYQKSPGRPRRLEEVARALVPILRDADRGLRHREIARLADKPESTVKRALLLLAGVRPDHYPEGLEVEELRVKVTRFSHAREGVARYSGPHGGWYWYEKEEAVRSRVKEERALPSKREQAWGAYVQLTLERIQGQANRYPRAFNLLVGLFRGPWRKEAEVMGLRFQPDGKLLTDSLLEGFVPWVLRRLPHLTWWVRPRVARWVLRPDLVDRPEDLADEVERGVRRWRRWAAQP